MSERGLNYAFYSERSIEDELDAQSEGEILTIGISYIIMFAYIAIALGTSSSWSRLMIDSKITLGLSGVGIVLVSVSASVGLFGYVGTPATLIIIEVIPFLVLAVGVDNIFILVQSYQRSIRLPNETMEDNIARVVGNVAPSMLLCSVAESTCFFLAVWSSLPAVQTFALYASVALIVNFLLQMTAFVALLALDTRRQEGHRFDLVCCIQGNKEATDTSKLTHDGFLYRFVKKFYAPFLLSEVVRPLVVLIFMAWLALSLVVVPRLEVGLDEKLSVPEDSYVYKYFEYLHNYVAVGPPVYFVVKEGPDVSAEEFQNKLCSVQGCDDDSVVAQIKWAYQFQNRSTIATASTSWIDDYYDWLGETSCCRIYPNGTYCPFEDHDDKCPNGKPCLTNDRPTSFEFEKFIKHFLSEIPDVDCSKAGKAAHSQAVQLEEHENGSRVLSSSFMAYHTILKSSQDFTRALEQARYLSDRITEQINEENNGTLIDVFAYCLTYVFYEQYLTTWEDTILSLVYSMIATYAVLFLLLGLDLITATINIFTIFLIIVNMAGIMYFWDVPLNGISLMNLVMAVGISVEFTSHLTRSFAQAVKDNRVKRAKDALTHTGSSVLSGITLTKFGGIVVLAFAKSQIFKVFFFKMYLLIVVVGALHGLVLLPVILSYFGPSLNILRVRRERKRMNTPVFTLSKIHDNPAFDWTMEESSKKMRANNF